MTRPPFTESHVHFFDLRHEQLRYEWLEPQAADPELGDYSAIKALRYWPEDFLGETRFDNVEHVIHVQAAIGTDQPVAETEWLQECSDRTGIPHGIVAYCDLAAHDAPDVLERHIRASPLVCGIRDLRYDDYLVDRTWRLNYARLEQYGLVVCDDPLLEHMNAARALAHDYPNVTLCIDHAGFPRERTASYFESWRKSMAEIAAEQNTVVKISGLGMCDHSWTVESFRAWVLTSIELWGVERSFFGTNWPVDRLYSSYGDVLDAYLEIIGEFSATEQNALFRGTANRVFGLAG